MTTPKRASLRAETAASDARTPEPPPYPLDRLAADRALSEVPEERPALRKQGYLAEKGSHDHEATVVGYAHSQDADAKLAMAQVQRIVREFEKRMAGAA